MSQEFSCRACGRFSRSTKGWYRMTLDYSNGRREFAWVCSAKCRVAAWTLCPNGAEQEEDFRPVRRGPWAALKSASKDAVALWDRMQYATSEERQAAREFLENLGRHVLVAWDAIEDEEGIIWVSHGDPRKDFRGRPFLALRRVGDDVKLVVWELTHTGVPDLTPPVWETAPSSPPADVRLGDVSRFVVRLSGRLRGVLDGRSRKVAKEATQSANILRRALEVLESPLSS